MYSLKSFQIQLKDYLGFVIRKMITLEKHRKKLLEFIDIKYFD